MGAVGFVDPVQHLVDGLGQPLKLILGGFNIDAGIQPGGVDAFQLAGELPHLFDGERPSLRVKALGLLRQFSKGGQGFPNLLYSVEEPAHQSDQLNNQKNAEDKHDRPGRRLQADRQPPGAPALTLSKLHPVGQLFRHFLQIRPRQRRREHLETPGKSRRFISHRPLKELWQD